MRRSVGTLVLSTELAIVAWWVLSVQFETGIDALQYHRMASAIMRNGLAPWAINPLSYLGIYPGSDSSGVPFLAASFSMLAGTSIGGTVLVYDAALLLLLGLGLLVLTYEITGKIELALLAVVMGSLAYGVFTTLAWALDERSFNVALAPLFLFLALPRRTRSTMHQSMPRLILLAITSAVMLVSHLSFLLLLPFLVLIPLILEVVRHQYVLHRSTRASLFYFGIVALSPLLFLSVLSQLGILNTLGLQYQLESSALFTGTSPLFFLLNAFVFLGTRVGPVNLICVGISISYLASRRLLPSKTIVMGAMLLAGLLGLPIVLYSKDLLTPIFVLLGTIGLGGLFRHTGRRKVVTLAVAALVITGASVAFNSWNLNRTSRAASTTYWAPAGVTPEMQNGNLWIGSGQSSQGCVYGNNAVLLQQLSVEPAVPFCTGLPIDLLINSGTSSALRPPPFRVEFGGFSSVNPSDWFSSPDIVRMTDDFARLPNLDFQEGRQLLLAYHVSLIVVDRQRPFQVPLYSYEGVETSRFFSDLWNSSYPVYTSRNVAIFRLS